MCLSISAVCENAYQITSCIVSWGQATENESSLFFFKVEGLFCLSSHSHPVIFNLKNAKTTPPFTSFFLHKKKKKVQNQQ